MTHVATIDKEKLQGITLAGILWLAHESCDFHQRGLDVKGYQLLVNAITKERHNALLERAFKKLVENGAIVC